jgi:hypothetical protein
LMDIVEGKRNGFDESHLLFVRYSFARGRFCCQTPKSPLPKFFSGLCVRQVPAASISAV